MSWQELVEAVRSVSWEWGPHDPPVAWVTTALYLLATLAAVRRLCRARQRNAGRALVLAWGTVAAFCVLLGLNKQADLHTFAWQVLREIAKRQGVYGMRDLLQVVLLAAVPGGMALLWAFVLWRLREQRRRVVLPLLGLCWIFILLSARVVSLHRLDVVLMQTVGGVALHELLEAAGVCLILANELLLLRPHAPRGGALPGEAAKMNDEACWLVPRAGETEARQDPWR